MIDLTNIGRQPMTITLSGHVLTLDQFRLGHAHEMNEFVQSKRPDDPEAFGRSAEFISRLIWLLARENDPDLTIHTVRRWYESHPAVEEKSVETTEADILRAAMQRTSDVIAAMIPHLPEPWSGKLREYLGAMTNFIKTPGNSEVAAKSVLDTHNRLEEYRSMARDVQKSLLIGNYCNALEQVEKVIKSDGGQG